MFRSLSKILVLVIGGALLVYSASRTVDFLTMTLPEGQQALAYVALLAFDGALVGWTLAFMFAAHNGMQRAIALAMVIVSLVAVTLGFGADTIIRAATNGVITDVGADFRLVIVLLTTLVIALNICATIGFHLVDNANRERMKAEDFDERIRSAADTATKDVVDTLAAELSQHLAQAKRRELLAQYLPSLADEKSPLSLPALTLGGKTPAKSTNGKVAEPELHTLNTDGVGVGPEVEAPKRTGRPKSRRG